MGRRWIHRNTLWYTLRGVLGLDPGSDRGRVRVGHRNAVIQRPDWWVIYARVCMKESKYILC